MGPHGGPAHPPPSSRVTGRAVSQEGGPLCLSPRFQRRNLSDGVGGPLTVCRTRAGTRATAAGVSSVRAKAVGPSGPAPSGARPLKPSVASFYTSERCEGNTAVAGMSRCLYQSFGNNMGALALTMAWVCSATTRSRTSMAAMFAKRPAPAAGAGWRLRREHRLQLLQHPCPAVPGAPCCLFGVWGKAALFQPQPCDPR